MIQTREGFGQELAELERQTLGGIDLAVRALDRVLEAVERRDMELAAMVVADDDRIDGRYPEVHHGLPSLLALQSPVATDLRVVAALLHVAGYIERIGDQCVNIAKMVPLDGTDAPVHPALVETTLAMGRQARAGPPGAGRVPEPGRRARARRRSRPAGVGDAHAPDRSAIERIGDYAVDIGEQVAFVVTGLSREFEDASHPAPRV